jgi:hypothetical protein
VANEKHLYAVFQGGYEDGSNGAEIWQFGVRLILNFGAVDDTGDLPSNWDVTTDSGSQTDGNWDSVFQFTVDGPGAETFDPMSYCVDYLQPSFEALMGTQTMSSHQKATGIKLSPINTAGHVILSRTVTCVANADIPGSIGGDMLPTEVAHVVSTHTAQPGRTGRGRVYLPAAASSQLDATGRADSGRIAEVVADMQAFFEGISYTGVGIGAPAVRPIVTGDPWTKYAMIKSIKVGDVFDSQRRRRNRLDETYVSQDLSYG